MLFWFIFIFVVFFCLGEFNLNGRWNRSLMQGLGISIAVLVAVLRFDVGYDYMSYYKGILTNNIECEPFSEYLLMLGKKVGYPPFSFMIIAVIIYSFIFQTLRKYSTSFFVASMIYICLFYLPSLNTIRQSLAVAITFWGIRYVYQKSLFKYIIVCIFASLFHYSALFSIVIYPLYHFMSAKYLPVVILTITWGYQFILESFLEIGFYERASERLLELTEDQVNEGGGSYTRLAVVAIVLIMYVLAWFKKLPVDYKLLFISAIGCVFPFILGSHTGSRIAEYFLIYLCLVIPQILCGYKVFFRMISIMIFIGYFLLIIVVGTKQKRASFLPYQTVFNITNIEDPIFRQP